MGDRSYGADPPHVAGSDNGPLPKAGRVYIHLATPRKDDRESRYTPASAWVKAMSAEAIGWVFRHSPYTGATFSVHLAIADSVNDMAGYEVWARQVWLSLKARVGRQACNTGMKALVDDGFLEVLEDNRLAGKANRYRFLFPITPQVFGGVSPLTTPGVAVGDRGGVAVDDTEPKSSNPTEPSVLADDSPPPSVTDLDGAYPDYFERFWDIWPLSRRGSKRHAYKAWRATVVREMKVGSSRRIVMNSMIQGTRKYLASREGEPVAFTKLAATFWGPNEHYKVDYIKQTPTRSTDPQPAPKRWYGRPDDL